ncbi:MAG: hypothetical protein Q9225_005317 [Loekoesia sp. 1 TL-2023]
MDDICAPPRSLSSNASLSDLDSLSPEPETPPPSKRRKLESSNSQTVDLTSPSPAKKARGYGTSGPSQPSNIRATSFISSDPSKASSIGRNQIPQSSQSSQHDCKNDTEEPFADFYSSQSKAKNQYGSGQFTGNIHKAGSTKIGKKRVKKEPEEKEHSVQNGSKGFIKFDAEPLLSIVDKTEKAQSTTDFHTPPVLSPSSRSGRATRRSVKNPEEQEEVARNRTYRNPPRPPSPEIKKSPTRQFVVPNRLSPKVTSRHSSKSSSSSQNVPSLEIPDLETIQAKLKIQIDSLTSSAALSSGPFKSDTEDGNSSSSLSSALDVENLDADQIHEEWVANYPPSSPKIQCPICKDLVSRLFMEEFFRTGNLNVRQQAKFCKAHKLRSAERTWRERGYPTIDWHRFGRRLPTYDAALSGVLNGTRNSFYRNSFEDQVKSGVNRTLQQSMMSLNGWEGLKLGYYGTKGARIIMEYIMSKFASQARKLAGTDRLISAGGVSGFVQAVLAPELAAMLVRDDMQVDDEQARMVLKESSDIGNLLNEEEDEAIKDEEEEGLNELR